MKINHIFRYCLIIILYSAHLFPATAHAQLCAAPFEVITTLRPPTFGFPTVWDAQYRIKDHMTQITSGIAREDGTVLTLGRSLSLDHLKPEQITLAEINRRGRILKEEKIAAKEGENPVKLISFGQTFIAISNLRGGAGSARKQARLIWYNQEGHYKRDIILQDAALDYEAVSLQTARDQSGFFAILRGINRHDESDQNGVIMKFSRSGDLIWRRVYRPGIPNMLYSLIPADGDHYIAVGRLRLEDGRMAGWAMKLGSDGSIQWQKTYPRGEFSVFRHAAFLPSPSGGEGGFILAGDSKPYDGMPEASWVMTVNALGEPLWQRYYRRHDYQLQGHWVEAQPDGRITIIMNAHRIEGEEGHDHIRILTLSRNGALITDESYYEGHHARATDYTYGAHGEHIIMATIEDNASDRLQHDEKNIPIQVIGLMPDSESEKTARQNPVPSYKPVYQGWVMIAPPLDPYQDPCLSTP